MGNIEERFAEWRQSNPLRQWREANGVSVASVAAATGVSLNMVVKWENGSNTPSTETMQAVAELMGVPKAELEQAWAGWRAQARDVWKQRYR